jgi:hypothetical protein
VNTSPDLALFVNRVVRRCSRFHRGSKHSIATNRNCVSLCLHRGTFGATRCVHAMGDPAALEVETLKRDNRRSGG